jgi:hypothetical protein
MFSKSNLVSTLVTAIWGFGGGYLLWGLLADPYFRENALTDGLMKDMPDMPYLIIGCVVAAFAFCTIYRSFGSGNYGVNSGLAFGFWLSIMHGLGDGLINHATSNMLDITGTMVNFGVYLVFYLVMGLIVGLIYGKMAATKS